MAKIKIGLSDQDKLNMANDVYDRVKTEVDVYVQEKNTQIDGFMDTVNDNFDELSGQVEETLGEQTQAINDFKDEVNGEIDDFKDDVNDSLGDMTETIQGLGQLQPSGVDTSTNILAKTTASGIWIGSDTGHWYYWNGTQYVDGGVYQAAQCDDEFSNSSTNALQNKVITNYIEDYTIGLPVVRSINLANPDDIESGYWIAYSTGVTVQASSPDNDWVRIKVKIKPNTNYAFAGFNSNVIITDNDGFVWQIVNAGSGTHGFDGGTFTSHSNAKWAYMYAYLPYGFTKFILEVGTTPQDVDYFPPYIKGAGNDTSTLIPEIYNNIDIEKKSLITPEDSWIQGGYLAYADGSIVDFNVRNWFHTKFIEVKPNTEYLIYGSPYWFLYDEDNTFKRRITATNSYQYQTIKTNSDEKYIRTYAYQFGGVNSIFLFEKSTSENYRPTYHIEPQYTQSPMYWTYGESKYPTSYYSRTLLERKDFDKYENVEYKVISVIGENVARFGKEYNYGQFATPEYTSLLTPSVLIPNNPVQTIAVSKENGKWLAYGTHNLNYVPENAGNGVTKKVMFIGDSTTDNTDFLPAVNDFFENDVMNINYIGYRNPTGHPTLKHCGMAGAQLNWFCTNSQSPFYDENNVGDNKFNFQTGLTRYSMETPDIVVIHLGINDIFARMNNENTLQEQIDLYLSQLDYVINSIHSVNASIIIGVAITIPPTRDLYGWSSSYSRNDREYYVYHNAWLEFTKQLDLHCNTDTMKTNKVYTINYKNALDDIYGFPTTNKKPFALAEDDDTIKLGNNGVHPSKSGYNQIAYQAYLFIKWTTTQ